jgi:hypothetical protein
MFSLKEYEEEFVPTIVLNPLLFFSMCAHDCEHTWNLIFITISSDNDSHIYKNYRHKMARLRNFQN